MGLIRYLLPPLLASSLFAVVAIPVRATSKVYPPVIKNLDLHDVSLDEAVEQIRGFSKADDKPYGYGLNIVIYKKDMIDLQKTARFSLVAENAKYIDVIYAICKRLGLGYRLEPYAIVIGPGHLIKLPKPSGPEAKDLANKIELKLNEISD